MVAVGVILLCLLLPVGERTGSRVATVVRLGTDSSFQWRLGMGDKARRMLVDRPFLGWGAGLFPIRQALYHHPAVPPDTERAIVVRGPNLAQNAHNSLLQLGAELGLPGLALYLGFFVCWFQTALK
ncbi:MAG: O-antigen ligase family protein, partial [Armatimonadetes bacterium]|nr:O-antigen ligase family protein [Armatimonadota bacterium]